MPPFASRAAVHADPDISPKLMIAIVGCLVVFLAIIIGFYLVASKKCCPPRSPVSNRRQSGPSCPHQHHPPAARRGLALPVASIPRCLACQKAHRPAGKASRVSQEFLHSPAPLSPYYARRAPTGVSRMQSWPERSPSSSVSSPTTPTTPPSTSLGYGARGPTATLRPAVW